MSTGSRLGKECREVVVIAKENLGGGANNRLDVLSMLYEPRSNVVDVSETSSEKYYSIIIGSAYICLSYPPPPPTAEYALELGCQF